MSRSVANGGPPPRWVGRPGRLLALLAALALIAPAAAAAQESDDCALLCQPELEIEPGVAIEPIFRSPRVAELEDGVAVDTSRETTAAEFELSLAVGIPTEIPRTELGFDVTWTPFVETDENLFTGRSGQSFRENVIEFAPEVAVILLTPEETEAPAEVALSVSDDISPAETPDAGSLFTHKLELAVETTVAPLSFLSEGNWLRNLEVEGALDYLATGVPQAGDEVPKGEERFLDDGARWGLSVVAIAPLAPLSP